MSVIAEDTFKTGQNKFTAQLTKSHKNVSNYLKLTSAYKGYLIADIRSSTMSLTALLFC